MQRLEIVRDALCIAALFAGLLTILLLTPAEAGRRKGAHPCESMTAPFIVHDGKFPDCDICNGGEY